MEWSVTESSINDAGYLSHWANALREQIKLAGVEAQDAVLRYAIQAAIDYAEERTASAIVQQTVRARYYADERLVLPRGPVISVDSVTDGDGNALEEEDAWSLRNTGLRPELVALRGIVYPVTVTYTAGFASADDLPGGLRLGILVHAATLYAHRESVSDKPLTAVPHSLDAFYGLKARSVGVG